MAENKEGEAVSAKAIVAQPPNPVDHLPTLSTSPDFNETMKWMTAMLQHSRWRWIIWSVYGLVIMLIVTEIFRPKWVYIVGIVIILGIHCVTLTPLMAVVVVMHLLVLITPLPRDGFTLSEVTNIIVNYYMSVFTKGFQLLLELARQ